MAGCRSGRRMRCELPAHRGWPEHAPLKVFVSASPLAIAWADFAALISRLPSLLIWHPSPHHFTRRLDLATLLDSDLARGLFVWRQSGLWVGVLSICLPRDPEGPSIFSRAALARNAERVSP